MFFFQAEDGIRDLYVTGVQTCALPISFADLEPRRGALDASLRDAMTRIRGVLQRIEARVINDSGDAFSTDVWIIGGALFAGGLAAAICLLIARSISHSVRDISDVAQAL